MLPLRALLACVSVLCMLAAVPALAAPVTPLAATPGAPLTRELRGGEAHVFALTLAQGQYAELEVLQRGVDVVVTVTAPDGTKLAEVDSPNGVNGPEPVAIAARVAGEYRVTVTSLDTAAPAGRYDLRVTLVLDAAEYARHSVNPMPPARQIEVTGAYESAPGEQVCVGLHGDLGGVLSFVDLGSRRLGVLHAHAPDTFFTGPTVLQRYPAAEDWWFRRDAAGRVVSLERRGPDGRSHTARRLSGARRDSVTFTNGGVTLRGVLLRPEGAGPHPAIVGVHGSGPADRWFAGPLAPLLVQQGFAVLLFDKRGAGESTGDWRTAPLDSLAADVLAGVEWLRARPDVDRTRIGLFGVSQGGWVGSLAARDPRVAFFVSQVGSGVPVWENVAHETMSAMRDAGIAGAELERGHELARRVFRMASEGADPAAVRAAVAADSASPALAHVWLLQLPPDNSWWGWFRANGRVDAVAALATVRGPVLWLLGDRDSQVPTAASEPRLRAALAASGDPRSRVVVFPHAGHPLMECETGLRSELPRLTHFVPGYLDTLRAWLAPIARAPVGQGLSPRR